MDVHGKQIGYVYQKNTPFAQGALHNVSFDIQDGDFVAIVGHTGSGKSTLVKMLNGLLQPDEGTLELGTDYQLPVDPKQVSLRTLRQKVGLVFQFPEAQLFEETVLKDVMFGPKNFGLSEEEAKKQAQQALEKVGIHEELYDRSPFELSGGQMRRVAIAGILSLNPEVLVLDEPVNGLDPNGMKEVRELLIKLNQEHGVTVFVSSHLLLEIEKMVTHIGIISHGEIKFQGSKEELNELYRFQKTKFSLKNAKSFESILTENYQVEFKNDNDCEIVTSSPQQISEINKILVNNGAEIYQISPAGGLEEWFMEISKQN